MKPEKFNMRYGKTSSEAKYTTITGGKRVKGPHNPDHDWCMLSDEMDNAMNVHAQQYTTHNCSWHVGFVDHLMEQYLKDSERRTVVDIGASYGWMAVSFANCFENVKCFEISPDLRYALRQNVRLFSNIEVFDYGLGDREDEVFILNTNKSGYTSVVSEEKYLRTETIAKKKDFKVHQYRVPIRPLDSFKFEEVDCIKIDVEGYEQFVLQGAIETIKKWKPLLVVEIIGSRAINKFHQRQQIFNMLKSIGYEIIDVRKNDYIFAQA